jgi:hypothetical protein
MLGLVRAGIAGNRSSRDVYCLHPATCNSCTQRTLSCHQYIALSTNRLRIEYAEHAERTYIAEIAEIDEGPNRKLDLSLTKSSLRPEGSAGIIIEDITDLHV